jgi:Ulp1 family protease
MVDLTKKSICEKHSTNISINDFPSLEVLQSSKEGEKVIFTIFSLPISFSSFQKLNRGRKLNDEIINVYMCLLETYNINSKVKFASTYFYENLMDKSKFNDGVGLFNYLNGRRFFKNFTIINTDIVYIPINLNNYHWILAVLELNLEKIKIKIYDSCGSSNDGVVKNLIRWLGCVAIDTECESQVNLHMYTIIIYIVIVNNIYY